MSVSSFSYSPPNVPLSVFTDVKDRSIVDSLTNNARTTAEARFGWTVKPTSELAKTFPLPLIEEAMNTINGKLVMVDPAIPYDKAAYEAAKVTKATTGKWPAGASRPKEMAVITGPFMLNPRSKPNGLGNDGDVVNNKLVNDGDQKRTVLTHSYPPFSCVTETIGPDRKPVNSEMHNIVAVISNFRRSVCDYLCNQSSIRFADNQKPGDMAKVNKAMAAMRKARGEAKDDAAKFSAYDEFMTEYCHANVKTPAGRASSLSFDAMPQEVTRFDGSQYVCFRNKVGFSKTENKSGNNRREAPTFVHRNPKIRDRLDHINATIKGGFSYNRPVIYYFNAQRKQWVLMTDEEADSPKWPASPKLICSVVLRLQFSPNGGPAMTIVRAETAALFVWGQAGDQVPADFAGGIPTAGEPVSSTDALAFLQNLQPVVDPENYPDSFSHEPQSESGVQRPKRKLLEDDDQGYATKKQQVADLTAGMSFDDEYSN